MPDPLIEIRSVSKIFVQGGKSFHILDDFSLTIDEGEFITVLGPSGCGKSTLLRILSGLERLDKGTIFFEGEPSDGPMRGIAIMFQSYDCFPWLSIASNVRLGLESADISTGEKNERVKKALTSVGLESVDGTYPHQLSGGMRQRVALARTLVGRPHVLLMDEPFGALDAQTREELQVDILELFRQGEATTIVFVTHDVGEAVRLGTRIIVLSDPPIKAVFDSSTRRADFAAPSDEDLIVRCRKALLTGKKTKDY